MISRKGSPQKGSFNEKKKGIFSNCKSLRPPKQYPSLSSMDDFPAYVPLSSLPSNLPSIMPAFLRACLPACLS
jgi:hypothetical protein